MLWSYKYIFSVKNKKKWADLIYILAKTAALVHCRFACIESREEPDSIREKADAWVWDIIYDYEILPYATLTSYLQGM